MHIIPGGVCQKIGWSCSFPEVSMHRHSGRLELTPRGHSNSILVVVYIHFGSHLTTTMRIANAWVAVVNYNASVGIIINKPGQ